MGQKPGRCQTRARCVRQRVRQMCAAAALLAWTAPGCARAPGPAADLDAGPTDGRATDAGSRADAGAPDGGATSRRIVILMIGDGMGPGQLEAASHYRHGDAGQLFMYTLPARGQISTGSLSGITDSAAAATTMATGAVTFNGRVGVDRTGSPAETAVEAAHRLGLAAGVVTTSSLAHATPGAFTAHRDNRADYIAIADDQAMTVRPEVMLGGGMQYYAAAGPSSLRTDSGLIAPLESAGYRIVRTAAGLGDLDPAVDRRVVGLFAADHMTYTVDREAASAEPTLRDMTLAALDILDVDDDGFFLVVEGARIDMASHGNDALRAITETLAFDDAVRAAAEWADGRSDVTLIVTADHECGGLKVITPFGAGEVPDVAWRWDRHTNVRVDVFARGPGADVFDGELRDHTWVHAAVAAGLEGRAVVEPEPVITPDGHTGDLRHLAATQQVTSGFGAGFNQLDALRVDSDAHGLGIGVEGVFQWDANAVVVLIDVDGDAAGQADLAAITDADGRADSILAGLNLRSPPGFAADFALTVFGGADPLLEELSDDAGLRGLAAPVGAPANLSWYGAAINFDDGVRAGADAATPVAASGLEAFIPWQTLYPGGGGNVPGLAEVAISVVLVNDDGGYTSNQALPPFAPGTANPGRATTPLPGVARFVVDINGDGVADGATPPTP